MQGFTNEKGPFVQVVSSSFSVAMTLDGEGGNIEHHTFADVEEVC